MNIHQPFRVLVSQTMWRRGREYKGRGPACKGARTAIEPTTGGFVAWTPSTKAEPWREGFGSFLFADIHATRAEVQHQLADARTRQISIRTNQDRTVVVINRQPDGRTTSFLAFD